MLAWGVDTGVAFVPTHYFGGSKRVQFDGCPQAGWFAL